MNNKIKSLIKDQVKLKELAEKVAGQNKPELVEEFKAVLDTELTLWLNESAASPDLWEQLFKETVPVDELDTAVLKEATNHATEICGDWNEAAAKLAQLIYEEKMGLKRKEYVELDSLYDIDIPSQKMEKEKFDAIPDADFLQISESGERRFLVNDRYTSYVAVKNSQMEGFDPELKTKILEKAVAFGIAEGKISVLECEGQALVWVDKTWTEENAQDVVDQYGLNEEDATYLEAAVQHSVQLLGEDQCAGNPLEAIEVSASSIISKFAEQESRNDFLAPLVGLVRSLGISKEKFEEAAKNYSCFGVTVLETLLNRAFTQPSSTDERVDPDSTENQVPTLLNPVAQASETEIKPSTKKTSVLEQAFSPINRRTTRKKETK